MVKVGPTNGNMLVKLIYIGDMHVIKDLVRYEIIYDTYWADRA